MNENTTPPDGSAPESPPADPVAAWASAQNPTHNPTQPLRYEPPADYRPLPGFEPLPDISAPRSVPTTQTTVEAPQAAHTPQAQTQPQAPPAAAQSAAIKQQRTAPAAPPARKQRFGIGALAGVAAGSLLLGIIIGAISFTGPGSGKPQADDTAADSAPGLDAAKASALVEEYLTALSEGDAAGARKAVRGSASDPLLSQEMLDFSRDLAPIDVVSVSSELMPLPYPDSDGYWSIESTYAVGDELIVDEFVVEETPGGWVLHDAQGPLYADAYRGLDLMVNGQPVTESWPRMFVGAYRVELDSEHFQAGAGDGTFIVTAADNASPKPFDSIRPQVTDEASQIFIELVRASIAECFALPTLDAPCAPPTSALSGESGAPLIDGTLSRQLILEGESRLKAAELRLSPEDPSVVSLFDMIGYRTDASFTDGSTGEVPGINFLRTPKIDFAHQPLTVVWE